MALQFNTYLLSGTNSIVGGMVSSKVLNNSTAFIVIYPTTVPFPSSAPSATSGSSGLPSNAIVGFNIPNGFSLSGGNTIILTNGTISGTAGFAGTLAWFAYGYQWTPTNTNVFISDSITLAGGGGVLTVNTMTPSSGEIITINFSLKII